MRDGAAVIDGSADPIRVRPQSCKYDITNIIF
jgi:hypothetical protein